MYHHRKDIDVVEHAIFNGGWAENQYQWALEHK
jgi:hypothetical protein